MAIWRCSAAARLAVTCTPNQNKIKYSTPGSARRVQGKIPQRMALEGSIRWDTRPEQASGVGPGMRTSTPSPTCTQFGQRASFFNAWACPRKTSQHATATRWWCQCIATALDILRFSRTNRLFGRVNGRQMKLSSTPGQRVSADKLCCTLEHARFGQRRHCASWNGRWKALQGPLPTKVQGSLGLLTMDSNGMILKLHTQS